MAVVINRSSDWANTLSAAAAIIDGLNKSRTQGKEEQLALLGLLSKQPGTEIQPVAAGERTTSNFLDKLFGGGSQTATGQPIFNVAGQQLKLGQRKTVADLLSQGDAGTVGAPGMTPVAPLTIDRSQFAPQLFPDEQPITETPLPTEPSPPAPMLPSAPSPPPEKASAASAPDTDRLKRLIVRAAQAKGIDPALALSVAMQESYMNPKASGDNGNSVGLFQLQPAAAIDSGLRPEDRTDVLKNIAGGTEYLAQGLRKYGGDPRSALERHYNRGGDPDYYNNVMRHYAGSKAYVESLQAAQAPPGTLVAGPGALAPPTATSTPPQDAAYRDNAAQRAAAVPALISPPPPEPSAAVAPGTTPVPPVPTPAPTPRAAQLTTRRIDAAVQDPSAEVVSVPGAPGPILKSEAVRINQRLQQLRAVTYLNDREGMKALLDEETKLWDNAAKYTSSFFKERDAAMKEYRWAAPAIRQAKNPTELHQILTSPDFMIAPEATRVMRTDILRRASGGIDSEAKAQDVANALAFHVEQGLPEADAKQLREDTGLSAWQDRRKQQALRPGERQAEQERAALAFQQKQREAGDPIIRAGEVAKAKDLEEAQQHVRQLSLAGITDTAREAAYRVLAQWSDRDGKPYTFADVSQTKEFQQQVQKEVFDTKARQMENEALHRPLTEGARLELGRVQHAKSILIPLKENFSDAERQAFIGVIRGRVEKMKSFLQGIGIGGDVKPVETFADDLGGVNGEKRRTTAQAQLAQGLPKEYAQQRFEQFLAQARLAESIGFDYGGKNYTGNEARVVMGFVPTAEDISSGRFLAKLDTTLRDNTYRERIILHTLGLTADSAKQATDAISKEIKGLGEQPLRGAPAPTPLATPPPAPSATPAPSAAPTAPSASAAPFILPIGGRFYPIPSGTPQTQEGLTPYVVGAQSYATEGEARAAGQPSPTAPSNSSGQGTAGGGGTVAPEAGRQPEPSPSAATPAALHPFIAPLIKGNDTFENGIVWAMDTDDAAKQLLNRYPGFRFNGSGPTPMTASQLDNLKGKMPPKPTQQGAVAPPAQMPPASMQGWTVTPR